MSFSMEMTWAAALNVIRDAGNAGESYDTIRVLTQDEIELTEDEYEQYTGEYEQNWDSE